MTGDIDWIEVNREAWEHLCHRVLSSEHKQYRLQEANVALHKGIRRLTKKVKELKASLECTQRYARDLESELDDVDPTPNEQPVSQKFIDNVLEEYQVLLKEESLRDQS